MADGYEDYSIGHLAGFDWDSGNLTLTLDYGHHSSLDGADRDFYTSDLRAQGGTDFRSQQCAPGNIVVNNVPYAIPAGGVTPATAGQLVANTRNLCDNVKRGNILPEIDRVSFMATGEQELGAGLTFFAEGFYSRREFELRDSQVVSNLTVTNANPFYVNPTGGTGPVTVQYDFALDGGLPVNPGYAESWQSTAGLRYDLPGEWQLEAYASYGESADQVRRQQNLNSTTAGINAFLANTNPAVAFNPFGPGGTNPATTVAAIRNGLFVIDGATELTVYAAKADGPLFELPGGTVRLAVGGEYREEELTGNLKSGSLVAPTNVPSITTRDIQALFAEVFVPITAQASPVGRIDLSVAGRYEEYSDFGDTFNPKVGLVWAPISSLVMRGSWGTSFRAPSLAENDPKSSGYGLYGDTLPCSHRAPATTCFGIGIAGGNPDLQPEEATTWSAGFDFTPDFLAGLRVSMTYFDIDYTNQIIGLRGTAGLLTNAIYSSYRILDPTAQQVNDLLASGLPINTPINASLVTYIQDGRRQNLGSLQTSGVDFDVSYRWETGVGDFNVGVAGAYFTELKTETAAGAGFVDVLDTINFPQSLRYRVTGGWRGGAASALVFVNYVGEYDQTGVTPVRQIDAWTTVDLHFGYELENFASIKGVSLGLDVTNVADEDPPFVNLSGGYDPQSANPLGRVIALSVRTKW
jgi:iron complex outermembrane receptor protein